jgi:hypothetical protein
MYADGRGVPEDDLQAYVWLNLAAAQLPQGEERTTTVALRDYIGARLSPAERARGQELARNWRPRVVATAGSGSTAYAVPKRNAPPGTQRQDEPNPFQAALELRARQNREIQQFLADLGYGPGPGRRGARAANARCDSGPPSWRRPAVDGEICDELYAALSEAVSSGQRVAARSAPTEPRLDSTGTCRFSASAK